MSPAIDLFSALLNGALQGIRTLLFEIIDSSIF